MSLTTHTVRAAFADGTQIDTFDEFAITHDMLAAGSAWTLALWYSATRNSTWDILRTKALLQALVTINLDDALQLVGVIETREELEARHRGEAMVISGRDVSGLAIDADADPRIALQNTTLGDALAAIFEPLGIAVNITDAAEARAIQGLPRRRRSNSARAVRTQAIDRFRIKPGEKIWQTADRICRQMGFLIWMAPVLETQSIDVVVDAPVNAGPPVFRFDRIQNSDGTFSGNIRSGSYRSKIRGIPTEVTGFAHSAMTASQDTRMQYTVFNDKLTNPLVVSDPLPQPRFLHREQSRSQDMIQQEARRLIADPMRDFRVYECEVQGFSQTVSGSEQLYTMNTCGHVRDDRRGLDEDMLITSITFKRSRKEGHVATVRMVPLGAIEVIPVAT